MQTVFKCYPCPEQFLPPAYVLRGKVIFTAHVRSTKEGNIYTWEYLSVHIVGGGYPVLGWGGVTPRPGMGYPPDLGLGTSPWTWDWVPAPPQTWDWVPPGPPSMASTWYAAGGMPLAFTQEDFLVSQMFWTELFLNLVVYCMNFLVRLQWGLIETREF